MPSADTHPPVTLPKTWKDSIVIGSHGPAYRGAQVIQRWIDDWFAQGGKVSRWEVTSFYYAGEAAFFEWDFACTGKWGSASFEGASVVTFANERIKGIREYRTTSSPYEWTA